jgi:pSer/pThr/pTyr-binding forkhead associated (FHA) protein
VKAQLLCRVRSGETRRYELPQDEAVIGRDPEAQVHIPVENVSRRHARIVWDGKQHWIEDLGSTNGTYVNERKVTREKLRHLNVIGLGTAVDIVFVLRSAEPRTETRLGIAHAFLIRNAADALPYEIPIGEITLGRSVACNIASESPSVSKVHARFLRTAERLLVRDANSANGTFVNGARVAEAPLSDGDVVACGGEEYRVSIAMGEVTSSTAPSLRSSEAPPLQPPHEALGDTSPRFSTDWRARVEGIEDEPAGEQTSRGFSASAPAAEEQATLVDPGFAAPRLELRLEGAGISLRAAGAGSYAIGRGPENALRVEDASVAPRQARLVLNEQLGIAFLTDESGNASTLRNGVPVSGTDTLSDGDVLTLGSLRLSVRIRAL